jgi:Icc protein
MASARTRRPAGDDPFVFLHVGDLHLTGRGEANARDLAAILDQIAAYVPREAFDFVYLPGDIAEDGTARQYAILRAALARHPDLPVRLIPGDHDRQHGSIAAFHDLFTAVAASPGGWKQPPVLNRLPQPEAARDVPQYYYAETVSGVRCLFVDMVSAGFGRKGIGLDFRLGGPQTLWLSDAIREAAGQGQPCAVFMHAYPDDLRAPDERLDIAGLIWGGRVRLVEMGHTHYNELAHDGRTLYAAARSVGQNEDGSVGYAVAAIDGPVTSWRFRALDRRAPFVLITSPADRRVATRPATAPSSGMVRDPEGRIRVNALVLSDREPAYCHCRVDWGPWTVMQRVSARRFEARIAWPAGARNLQVEAVDARWPGHGPDFVDTDEIEPPDLAADPQAEPALPAQPGSDAARVGAWLRKGVRGDQLGPNRAGRKW